GKGSYGQLAAFKAEVVNRFVKRHCVQTVIEFGCGDGNQLSLFEFDSYIGVDVSAAAVELCRKRFSDIESYSFYTLEEFFGNPHKASLTLSLDVIFHLVEDDVYEIYMNE